LALAAARNPLEQALMLEAGQKRIEARVGEPVLLVATVTDDGACARSKPVRP
jgi:hypothetical protein